MMPDEFMPGKCLGAYKIGKYIDGGEFSEVFSVTSKTKESLVAKVFLEEHAGETFERELSIVKKLPKVTYFGYFVDVVEVDDWKILILANCGPSLKSMLSQKEPHLFSSQNTVKTGLHLLNVLNELHNMNILHRDVHLGNVTRWFPNNIPCISLIDYGLSIEDGGASTKFTKSQDILDIFTILLQCRSVKRNVFRILESQEIEPPTEKQEPEDLMGNENVWIWDIYRMAKAQHGFPVPYDDIRTALEKVFPNFDVTTPIKFAMTDNGMLLE